MLPYIACPAQTTHPPPPLAWPGWRRCSRTGCLSTRWRCCRRTRHTCSGKRAGSWGWLGLGMGCEAAHLHLGAAWRSFLGVVHSRGQQPAAALFVCAHTKMVGVVTVAGRWGWQSWRCTPSATSSSRRQRTRALRARRPAARQPTSSLQIDRVAAVWQQVWGYPCVPHALHMVILSAAV